VAAADGVDACTRNELAEDIGAKWLVPMHYQPGEENDFVTHMLGQRPHQQFKVFEVGEKWTVPED